MICALAGWALIGRIGSVSPQGGQNANIESITAVVIGGTSLFGGRGSIVGTMFGALIVGVFGLGLRLWGTDPQWTYLSVGALIIIAVAIDQWIRKVVGMTQSISPSAISPSAAPEPLLYARGLVKRFGRVVALDGCDFDLYPGEILGLIGDNGAGKSTLIKGICGAMSVDAGEIWFQGKPVSFRSPMEAREAGIETVYQTLALSPALSIADNMFLGREIRKPGFIGQYFRMLDHAEMEKRARAKLSELGLLTIQNIGQAVETLSGGQR